MELHCYLVTYDISSPRRWRTVFQTLHGYGEHVQLSVFRCDLTPRRLVQLKAALSEAIHHREDQVLISKIGKSTQETLRGIIVLGKPHEFRLPGPTIVWKESMDDRRTSTQSVACERSGARAGPAPARTGRAHCPPIFDN